MACPNPSLPHMNPNMYPTGLHNNINLLGVPPTKIPFEVVCRGVEDATCLTGHTQSKPAAPPAPQHTARAPLCKQSGQ